MIMGDRLTKMRSPKVIHITVLEPRICVTLPLHGKKDFAYVIRFRFLKWETTLDQLGGPTVTTRVLPTDSSKRRIRVRKGNNDGDRGR